MNEMWMEVGTLVLRIVIVLCVGAVTKYVLPWVSDTVIPWLKDKRLYDMICRFVRAAQKLADTGAIDKTTKKEYVISLLKAKGVVITPEVDAMIESAVFDLDLAVDSIGDMIFDLFDPDDEDGIDGIESAGADKIETSAEVQE